jgi:hypothetical protein
MVPPPLLWPSLITPANEVAAIKDLHASLWGVAYNVEAWSAALNLFKMAKEPPSSVSPTDARQWKFIASNECVLQLDHLRERLEKIKGHKVHVCQSLSDSIDFDKLRSAPKMLDKYFVGIYDLRCAVAHAGAIDVLPAKHAPESGYLLHGFNEPDRFSAAHNGIVRHLDITDLTLMRIQEIVSEFFLAFAPAASLLECQGHLD